MDDEERFRRTFVQLIRCDALTPEEDAAILKAVLRELERCNSPPVPDPNRKKKARSIFQ